MTADELERGRRYLEQATPGPWRAGVPRNSTNYGNGRVYVDADKAQNVCFVPYSPESYERRVADSALIAWLRNNAAELIAATEQMGKV